MQLKCPPQGTEVDLFFAAPQRWLEAMEATRKLPEYVVLFDPGEELAREWLDAKGYKVLHRFFNSHFAEDRGLNRETWVFRLEYT